MHALRYTSNQSKYTQPHKSDPFTTTKFLSFTPSINNPITSKSQTLIKRIVLFFVFGIVSKFCFQYIANHSQ
jgi:hypothetical protein